MGRGECRTTLAGEQLLTIVDGDVRMLILDMTGTTAGETDA